MSTEFWSGFEKCSEDGPSDHGTHINYIHSKGLSDEEFGSLKASIAHVGDYRKQAFKDGANVKLGPSSNWRDDALSHFHEKHPHLKEKVWAGRGTTVTGKNVRNGQVVVASRLEQQAPGKPLGNLHSHGHYVGGEPAMNFTKHFSGTHEKVAGRVDRFLNALKKKPKLLPQVHAKVRAKDLSDQFRGIVDHSETSLQEAVKRVKKTQAKGGFGGTNI